MAPKTMGTCVQSAIFRILPRPDTTLCVFLSLIFSGNPNISPRTSVLKAFFSFLLNKSIYLFIWLRWVFVAVHGLSLVAVSRGYSSLRGAGFSLRWLLLLWSTGSRHAGFSSCGTWAQSLWRTGLVAPWHVGSSRTRARTRVPCIGRQILNHCATREVP